MIGAALAIAVRTTAPVAVLLAACAPHYPRYVPFLLEGVGGVPRLNQADGIHPSAEGQRIVADVVWPVLEPVVRSAASRRPAASSR